MRIAPLHKAVSTAFSLPPFRTLKPPIHISPKHQIYPEFHLFHQNAKFAQNSMRFETIFRSDTDWTCFGNDVDYLECNNRYFYDNITMWQYDTNGMPLDKCSSKLNNRNSNPPQFEFLKGLFHCLKLKGLGYETVSSYIVKCSSWHNLHTS